VSRLDIALLRFQGDSGVVLLNAQAPEHDVVILVLLADLDVA